MTDPLEDSAMGIEPQGEDVDGDGIPDENVQPVTSPEALKLQSDVKEGVRVKQETGEIRKRVVDALVEDEVAARADLLAKALAKRKAQAKELEKIRPDNVGHTADGNKVFEHFSKARLGERQKAEKTLAKLDNAINAAICKADYEGLKKITQSVPVAR